MAKPPVLRSAPRSISPVPPVASFWDVGEGTLLTVPISSLVPWKDQPRKKISDFTLEELAASIKEKGILQPILVRSLPDGSRTWQIIAGERRWRAAAMAGLADVPVLVRSMNDADALIVALIENLQREDLNIMDRARALRRLYDHLGSWVLVGKAVGFGEESLGGKALTERRMFQIHALNALPDSMQEAISKGDLTEKHGRAMGRLKTTEQQGAFFEVIQAHQLSGPEAETLLRLIQQEESNDLDYSRYIPKVRPIQKSEQGAVATAAQLVRVAEELSRLIDQAQRLTTDSKIDESIDRALKKVESHCRAWRRTHGIKPPLSALPPGL